MPSLPLRAAPAMPLPLRAGAAGPSATPTPAEGERALLPDARCWGRLFGDLALPADETQALNRIARGRRLQAGDTVFHRGATATALVLLCQGDAALGGLDGHGQFRTERHLQGPAWLDLSAGWLGSAHAHEARVLSPAIVIKLDCAALGTEIDHSPALARRLMRALARESQQLALNTRALMHQDAPARWAAWLLARFQPQPEAPGRGVVQLPLRKRDIASQLAITPETLSRLMRSLSSRGVIAVAGYTVHVLDRAALARMAGA